MKYFTFIVLLASSYTVSANTEKAIFLGPSPIEIPTQSPTISDLRLDTLSPQNWSLRTRLTAAFPTDTSKYGIASWFLLQGLREGQRYEVRVCWAATNPTSFRLETYELQKAFETPELIGSLAEYAESREPTGAQFDDEAPLGKMERDAYNSPASILLLQIFTAADYYTMNETLMQNPPPVLVDIILDPFLLNVFPRSLLPTAAYIVILAIGAWFLSRYISDLVQSISQHGLKPEKKTS